jgi:uncharacterized membrane protein
MQYCFLFLLLLLVVVVVDDVDVDVEVVVVVVGVVVVVDSIPGLQNVQRRIYFMKVPTFAEAAVMLWGTIGPRISL